MKPYCTIQTKKNLRNINISNYLYFRLSKRLFFFIWLVPLGVATGNHLPVSHLIPSVLFCHSSPVHVLLRYIHESYLWSFLFYRSEGVKSNL